MKENDGDEISYEILRQERIKANMERMQKLGIADLSKKLISKPPLPKKSIRRNKNETKISESHRRSSRLQNLTPISYIDDLPKAPKERRNRPKTPKEPRNLQKPRNHLKDEDDEEEEEEDEEEEEVEEEDEYNIKGFQPELCGRRSSRLEKATRVSYTEISPNPKEMPEIEIEDEAEGKDVLVGEEIDTKEEHKKNAAEQPVSAKRYIAFDDVEHSLYPSESVNSPTNGKPLDMHVGEVTSSQQT
ncbi:hypothetical protein MKW94_028763 [Papaver nudicaule]|uniref:Uncharacterized protein n=1 Tax=Papaver nudicaule TaxID=74823 RepID=A0AA41V2I4_PAPNU|nr:hypothetical protein [Papaver nudicaule]MCL7045206.1 hypothetical protein [Papaver nudicaule]